MKFQFISAHRETFKVGRMCSLLNVSRSGYYAWLGRPESRRSRENRILKDKIRCFMPPATAFMEHLRSTRILLMTAFVAGKTALPESCAKPASDLEPKGNSKQRPTPITSCR
jgi:hypothetical protein